jgi:glycerate kinase
MHRVLIAPDKFKGTLTSRQAARAIRVGLQRAWPDAQFTEIALADGGEGFTDCLVDALHGRAHTIQSVDAANHPCIATWGELASELGSVAALDIASASGLAQLRLDARNPELTSTFGTGLVLREIIARGLQTILVGLGGSATNDGGTGIAAALGFRFLDVHGNEVPTNGAALASIVRIEGPRKPIASRIVIATDVENPLYGSEGAAHRFAAQKGANPDMVARLDAGLRHFAAVVANHVGHDYSVHPGAGAAGGAGFGMLALLGAQRRSGFDILREQLQLDRLIEAHDLVVTGEGAFDATSLTGKAPAQLAQLVTAKGRRAWAVFGRCDLENAAGRFDRYATLDGGVTGTLETHLERVSRASFELAKEKAPPQRGSN